MKKNTKAQLSQLLQERNEYPDRAAEIDAKVREIFGETHAVLVMDMNRRLSAANTMLPEEMDMHGKFGIGYGEVLIVEDEDLFGSEVNLASKLGEDLAERGEILLTESAFAEVEAERRECEEVNMSISGLQLRVHRVVVV